MLFGYYLQDFLDKNLPYRRRKKEKIQIRAISEQHRRVCTPEEVESESAAVIAIIEQAEWFKKAKNVMIYYPIRNEINLLPLFEKYKDEKTFILPVTHRYSIELRKIESIEGLKKGHFGIPEPQTPTFQGKIDLILVPGVAFDKGGHRIGRGGGYYDRFLKRACRTKKIGVGYDFQFKKSKLPVERHDVMMDGVVTPHHATV